jgi:hypothetical protein
MHFAFHFIICLQVVSLTEVSKTFVILKLFRLLCIKGIVSQDFVVCFLVYQTIDLMSVYTRSVFVCV